MNTAQLNDGRKTGGFLSDSTRFWPKKTRVYQTALLQFGLNRDEKPLNYHRSIQQWLPSCLSANRLQNFQSKHPKKLVGDPVNNIAIWKDMDDTPSLILHSLDR